MHAKTACCAQNALSLAKHDHVVLPCGVTRDNNQQLHSPGGSFRSYREQGHVHDDRHLHLSNAQAQQSGRSWRLDGRH